MLKQTSVFGQEQRASVDHIAHRAEAKRTLKQAGERPGRDRSEKDEVRQQESAPQSAGEYHVRDAGAAKQAFLKIKPPNQRDIEVKFTKNKAKMNYIKKPEKPAVKKQSELAHEGNKALNTSQSSLPQGLGNPNSIFNKRPIQINTNLEPSQSKKQYEMALAQAKQYIK